MVIVLIKNFYYGFNRTESRRVDREAIIDIKWKDLEAWMERSLQCAIICVDEIIEALKISLDET
jgi:hypothetical protein